MHGEISVLSASIYIKNRMTKKGYNKYLDLLNADPDVACKDLKIPSGQMSEILKECTEKLKSQYKIEEVQEVLEVPIDFQGDLTGTLIDLKSFL